MRVFKILLIFSFCLVVLTIIMPIGQAQKPINQAFFTQTLLPFLSENCTGCHSEKQKAGGLNLELFMTADSISKYRDEWESVVHKLRTGEMPPKGMPRPPQATIEAVIQWLELQFAQADKLVKPDPGRITARRLNRAEYNNTVRDLLGIDSEPANDFPQDDSAHGFGDFYHAARHEFAIVGCARNRPDPNFWREPARITGLISDATE